MSPPTVYRRAHPSLFFCIISAPNEALVGGELWQYTAGRHRPLANGARYGLYTQHTVWSWAELGVCLCRGLSIVTDSDYT